MYAVINFGGKQHRVATGDIIQIEKLDGDVGSKVKFDQVLMVAKPNGEATDVALGKPMLAGATVEGEIVGQGRGDKILIVKMKRRKQYRRTQGHRQFYTQVLVTVLANGADKATLSSEERTAKLSKFQSHLKPKGEAFSPKQLGKKRNERAQAAAPAAATESKSAAPKKSAPKAKAKK